MPPNKVRKRPEEYSTNPNTVRARARKARLTPYQKELEQARASDTKAITRAWKDRTKTDAYAMSTDDERKTILDAVEKEVRDRRRKAGLDAESKISRFMKRMRDEGQVQDTSQAMGPITPNSMYSNGNDEDIMDPASKRPRTAGASMQPNAPMLPPPVPSYGFGQVGSHSHSSSRYATPGSYYPYATSSVEGYRAVSETASGQQYGSTPGKPSVPSMLHYQLGQDYVKHEAQPGSNVHSDMAAYTLGNANVHRELNEMRDQCHALSSKVQHLSNDLVLAKSSLAAQDRRVEALEHLTNRMLQYNEIDAGARAVALDSASQTEQLRRIVCGVHKIAEVTADVAQSMLAAGSGIVVAPVAYGAEGMDEANAGSAVIDREMTELANGHGGDSLAS